MKERFGKPGGNAAYHAYQSFKPGEVTPSAVPQAGCKTGKGVTRSQPKKLGAKKKNGRPQASTQNWKMFVPSLLLQYFFQTGALLEL